MVKMKKHLDLLGMTVTDRVTGFSGAVVSVIFDLYGCIQALVHPGLDQEGKIRSSEWFDVNRLKVTSETPVMERDRGSISSRKVSRMAIRGRPSDRLSTRLDWMEGQWWR